LIFIPLSLPPRVPFLEVRLWTQVDSRTLNHGDQSAVAQGS
jgi:hypothetical protein